MSDSTGAGPARCPATTARARTVLAASGALALLAATLPAQAPPPFPISTDRPSISATPTVVPAGHWLLESGVTVGGGIDAEDFMQLPELVLRRGLSRRLEATVALPSYRAEETPAFGFSGAGRRVTGATDPSLALRLAMLDAAPGSPLRPTVSALVGTSLPLGTTFTSDQAQPSATLMAGWTLGSRLGVLTNAGYTWAAGGQGVARLSGLLSATVGPRGGIFAEAAFQRPPGGWGRPLLSLGFTQLVGSRGQLDLFTRRVGAAGDYVEFGFGLSLAR